MSHANRANICALFATIILKALQLHIIRNQTISQVFSPRPKHTENHAIFANMRNHARIIDTVRGMPGQASNAIARADQARIGVDKPVVMDAVLPLSLMRPRHGPHTVAISLYFPSHVGRWGRSVKPALFYAIKGTPYNKGYENQALLCQSLSNDSRTTG